ncbi:DUF2314 domain-containing protein [Verrucomicrobia bacterium]|nr:DUF2314 domain-containing protein [Verrucomicrobiota bacterium]
MSASGGLFIAGVVLFGTGRFWGRSLSVVGVLGLMWISFGLLDESPMIGGTGLLQGVAGLWCLFTIPLPTDMDEPLTSMVLLLSKPMYADSELLRDLFSKVIGPELEAKCTPADEEEVRALSDSSNGKSFITGKSPIYMLSCDEGMFIVHDIEEPYMDEPEEAAEEVTELRTAAALRDHKAWVAVDLMHPKDLEVSTDDHYKFIGRLVAELAEYAESNCIGIFIPGEDLLFPFDAEMLDSLRAGKSISGLKEHAPLPVVQVEENDEEMKKATESAVASFPEFIEAFSNRKPGDATFAIKAPFTSEDNTEFLWLLVTEIDGDEIKGNIDNEPVDLPGFKEGDEVTISVSDLNDWSIMSEDGLKGAYTMKVLQEAHRRAVEEPEGS